ncbi:hypothetical protein JTE90_028544 [Oedothorax gibbosus]|uniref:Uncharacterized protein n=1 Tax=Oedothorax gibbosus TaxID=931172 RepID=A0AAV6VW58_9ARAC|nr:hypothetical protein JTE90_028544 [Oedothorax gibbosus]
MARKVVNVSKCEKPTVKVLLWVHFLPYSIADRFDKSDISIRNSPSPYTLPMCVVVSRGNDVTSRPPQALPLETVASADGFPAARYQLAAKLLVGRTFFWSVKRLIINA